MNVLEVLKNLFPESSKTTIRSWISQGRVSLNGIRVKRGDEVVPKGGKVELQKKEKQITGGVKILYKDQDLVVIDKPSGLLSVATRFETESTAHGILKELFPRIFVIHRLDQDTSGVMLFGLSERSFEPLKEQFKLHSVQRRYLALVEGKLEGKGTWVSRLEEDRAYHVHVVKEGGEEAVTHWESLAIGRKYSLVGFNLETGKKNQIRVQAADAGFPVTGDKKYGAKDDPIGRLALHAHLLSFLQPLSRATLSFTSPPPPSFSKFV